MGFATVTWPVSACYTMAKALRETYAALLRDGHTNNVRDRMVDFEEFNNLIGLPQVRETEAAYDEYAREMVEIGERGDATS
jgi:methylisocitrate lyase